MPIDLPEGSLGPVPTKKQMELLRKMATAGATVHTWTGTSIDSHGAYIQYTPGKTEKVGRDIVGKFHDWGWLVCPDPHQFSHKGHDYLVSERGRKVIERGKTR